MSCVASNWFRRKREQKKTESSMIPTVLSTDFNYTPEQYDALLRQKNEQIDMLVKERNECLAKTNVEDPLESYWNNKRPKSEIKYAARPAFGSLTNQEVDLRIFWVNDPSLPNLWTESNDKTALACQQYVINKITYLGDMSAFKDKEVWLFPFETMALRKGDCEDGAILMANLMLRAGIPYWRIRINAGDVKVAPTAPVGGHAYVTYLREKDNKWYLLDWCFFPEQNFGALFHDNENYYGIWFSFNTKYIYVDESFDKVTGDCSGRQRLTKHRDKDRAIDRKRAVAKLRKRV